MNRKFSSMLLASAVIALAGCSGSEQSSPVQAPAPAAKTAPVEVKPLAPVTIRFHQLGGYFTEQDFKELIVDPVKKKYPHITAVMDATTEDLPVLLTKGDTIDFLVTYHGRLINYIDMGVYFDITPLAKQHNIDLSRFEAGALDAITSISGKKELIALPYANNLNALYYNKDLFDKFGVAYPKDGMLWEETIDLAKKVTRQEGGVQYRGLDTDSLGRYLSPLSLNHINAANDEVYVNTEPYKRVMEIARQIYAIPGNEYNTNVAIDKFLKDRNIAMLATVNLFLRLREAPDLNWDVAQYPSFKERPNTYGQYDLHLAAPMANSKNREDQMRVLEVLFSDEVQTTMSRKSAKQTVMRDSKYKQMFAQDLPEMKGKNIAGVFKSSSAPAPVNSIYFAKASSIVTTEFTNVVTNKKDVNTALRDADEQIKLYIKTEKGK
ncbi:MAG: transporter substrate-binding protein [Paenibacillus sp.]|jgi:multiple sugar transport system substrate-binding protein|nr:transporter substrate-binding protein [Paenibacillus sp.]